MSIFPFDHLSKKLKPNPSLPISISNRGQWNHFLYDRENGNSAVFDKDFAGTKIYEQKNIGQNTTLYVFDERSIRLADPCAPSKMAVFISLPTMIHRAKEASSASNLCVCGWNPVSKSWEAWHCVVDLDTLGYVPHVSFYKRAGSEWKLLPDLKNKNIEDEIGGFKMMNHGEHRMTLHLWFKRSQRPYRYTKHVFSMEEDTEWKTTLIE